MHILILQNGWSGQGISGGDKHLIEVASFWKDHHDVSLRLPGNGRSFLKQNFGREIKGLSLSDSWEIIPFKKLKSLAAIILSYGLRTLGVSGQMILSRQRFDVVISSSHFFYDLFPLLMAKVKNGSKLVVYVYHLVGHQSRPGGLRNRFATLAEAISLSLMRKWADAVLTDNLETQKQLIDGGMPSFKVSLIKVGLRRPPVERRESQDYDLCFLGRLVATKGVEDLVKLMEILKSALLSVKLVLVGTGDEFESLTDSFEQKGFKDSVFFLGSVDELTKYRVLRSSKIFVFPSYEEGWGLSLGEALSCGLPSVAYDLKVIREVFKDGPVLVKRGDVSAMASVIQRLLEDKDYYQQKSIEASRSVADFYLDQLAPAELSLIERL